MVFKPASREEILYGPWGQWFTYVLAELMKQWDENILYYDLYFTIFIAVSILWCGL